MTFSIFSFLKYFQSKQKSFGQNIWHRLYRNVIEILVDRNIHDKSKSIVLKRGEKKKLIHDVERVWQELLYANVPPFYRDAPHNGFKSILKDHTNNFHTHSWVLLFRQIWIVNYYVKCLSDNLSNNENKNNCGSRKIDISKIVHFGILIHVLSWNIYFRLLKKKRELKINNYLME